MSLLAAETFCLGHRNALQPNVLQRLLHLVEFERFYDRLDFFHLVTVSPAGRRFGSAPPDRARVSRLRAKPSADGKYRFISVLVGLRASRARSRPGYCLRKHQQD